MTARWRMALSGLVGLLTCAAAPAHADMCTASRQYILDHASNVEGVRPQSYQTLSKICEQTLALSNVKDAFVLQSGAIAVIPKRDGVSATAITLSEFCTRFPRATLRFVARKEVPMTANIGRAVRLDASTATPCQKIVQGG